MSAGSGLAAVAADLLAPSPDGSPPPGAVLGVATVDGRAEVAAAGRSSAGPEADLSVDARFDIASVTKVLGTAAAIMRLVGERQLVLDTPVRRILPTAAVGAESTVRDLLGHRAGLWEWQPLYLAEDEPFAALDALPARYPPGSGYHYSDLGFMLLGRIIETVTGDALPSAFDELVFAPLALRASSFRQAGSDAVASSFGDRAEREMVLSGRPYPVRFGENGFAWREHVLVGEVNDGNCHHAFGGVAGHAGLFSSVPDLLRFALSLIEAAGDATPWPFEVVQKFFAAGPDPGQALGFRRQVIGFRGKPVTMLWHPGFTGCAVGVIPELGAAVAMATNRLLVAGEPRSTMSLWRSLLDGLGRADAFDSRSPVPTDLTRTT